MDKRVRVTKFDKHPNVKVRRNYKDMVSFEVELECILNQHKVKQKALMSSLTLLNNDSSTPQPRRTVFPLKKRNESPDLVNINIKQSSMSDKRTSLARKETNHDELVVSKFSIATDLTALSKVEAKKIIPAQLKTTKEASDALKDVKFCPNDDLELESDSQKTEYSGTSEELSQNSETYDFMKVYMPLIRPIAGEETEEEEIVVEDQAKSNKKTRRGFVSPSPRKI